MSSIKAFIQKFNFYGWYVVAILFFSCALGVGSRQALGLFVDPWAQDFGVSVFTDRFCWLGNKWISPTYCWETN